MDTGDHRIRKVSPSGTITTVAGNGTPGYAGDGHQATSAELFDPEGVAGLPHGGFLIADTPTGMRLPGAVDWERVRAALVENARARYVLPVVCR